ncbi:MAG: FHA domain-containing protein, partial [Polyangiaceae bacterium]|nr:FHA domain-containing protein [Polyangiaceae bacterium]
IGGGVRVLLGGEVPCAVTPLAGGDRGWAVEIAGERYVAPLGDLPAGPWRIRRELRGGEPFVVLRTPPGAPPPFLGDFQLAAEVELCAGDAISASRGGPVVLRLPGAPGAAPPPAPSRPSGGAL